MKYLRVTLFGLFYLFIKLRATNPKIYLEDSKDNKEPNLKVYQAASIQSKNYNSLNTI